MSSVLFLITVVAVVLLVVWLIRNEAPGLDGGEGGLFGMVSPSRRSRNGAPLRWRRGRSGG